jgi:ribosomal protein S18 acetylase RimI-like enzyme
MTLALRSLLADDLGPVLALWRATPGITLNESDTPDALMGFLARNPGLSVVAVDDATLVGACLVGHDGRRGWIYHLAVAVTHRRRGLGRAMVVHGVNALAHAGIHRCNLFVTHANADGRTFWERLGFTIRDDLIPLQKRLPA